MAAIAWWKRPDGQRLICHPRGKKSQAVVGDRVLWQAIAATKARSRRWRQRRNLFYRQDEIRTKSFAANLDQVLILIAAEPEFSESQLARALIAAEAERITPLIALEQERPGRTLSTAPGPGWSPTARMGYHGAAAGAQAEDRCAGGDDAGQQLQAAADAARQRWCWAPRAPARAR